jgi:ABC-type oligopeptide transport system, periplasmic component
MLKPDGRIAPGVARSWDISNDGRTYVFHLRDDARWSNGEPVTAQDFVYAWRREVDPATAAQYAEQLSFIHNAGPIIDGKLPTDQLGVQALDAHTLKVELDTPTPYFLPLLAMAYMYPLYPPAIQRWGGAWTQPGHMVSDGAFMLHRWIINGHLTLLRNPHYWDVAAVELREVRIYPISDASAVLSRYLADNLDFAASPAFPASDADWLRKRLGKQVVIAPYYGNAYLGLRVTQPPFDNRDLRLALSMALDRHILADKIGRGLDKPAWSLMPPLPGYTQNVPDWAHWPRARRLAEARRLYGAAGYSKAHPLKVDLWYPTAGVGARQFMEAVATMWRENLGAKIGLRAEQFKVLLQDLQYGKGKLFWSAWIGDYPDPYTFMQLFRTGFAMNYGKFDDPQYDDLLQQASMQQDLGQRYALFHQAEGILNREMPYIPLYFYTSQNLVKPWVQGWQPNLFDYHPSRWISILAHRRQD